MQRPGFWDDQEAAARTSAAHARAQRKLKTFEELESEVADLEELAEMTAEDEEMAAELTPQLSSVERRLAELEEARLFSGEYDSGDAVVSVHAGAGGTDSQDWAEILLRMYLRWAERRGFDVEMKEASPGEGTKLSSLPDYLKAVRTYCAIAFASLSEIIFASKRVIPGPGFRILPTMSSAVLTPWASMSFLWSVKAALMIFPPFGWQTAQCS